MALRLEVSTFDGLGVLYILHVYGWFGFKGICRYMLRTYECIVFTATYPISRGMC